MTQLAGAHVLVTGGSSGIGLATAARCRDRGAAVSIVARDEDRLARARDQLWARRSERLLASHVADVTDVEELDRAVTTLTETMGPVDVLVTSAGEAHPGLFTELSDDVFRAQMEVGYFGTLHAARAVVPSMIERGRGHLVFVASTVALLGVYGYSAYAPAKYAVRGLAETLRPELKPHGVVVSCAYPPDTDTPGLAREDEHKPEATKRISATIKPRSADAVADAIVRGIERNRLVITADPQTAALARAGGLVAPVLNATLDRKVREPRK